MEDIINQPKHYTSNGSGIECIEVAELLPFCLGNCYKYLYRAGQKGDILTDLRKAQYYAKRAYFNNEQIHERAKNRILEVSRHCDGLVRPIMQDIAYFNDKSSRGARIFETLANAIGQLTRDDQ